MCEKGNFRELIPVRSGVERVTAQHTLGQSRTSLPEDDMETIRESAAARRGSTAPENRVLDFLRDPEWPNQKVNHALEKSRLVALDAVPAEEKNPSQNEQRQPYLPAEHQ